MSGTGGALPTAKLVIQTPCPSAAAGIVVILSAAKDLSLTQQSIEQTMRLGPEQAVIIRTAVAEEFCAHVHVTARPASSLVNASLLLSRAAAHDSRPTQLAVPFVV